MAITLKQLAAELKVSPATVSLALRDSSLVATDTAKKVKSLAAKYHYVQNNIGRALQAGKTKVFGYLLHGITISFFNEILQAVGNEAESIGYGLMVGWVNNDVSNIERQVNLMLEKDVDGLIISEHTGLLHQYIDRCLANNKPVVYCTQHSSDERISSICTNDFLGGMLAITTLAKYGHHRILATNQSKERYNGNVAAAKESNVELILYKNIQEAISLLINDSTITAVATYSDEEALGLMFALKEFGKRIPEDISIIGFDDLPLASRPEFNLSTIAQQKEKMGRMAVKLLVDKINKPHKPANNVILDPRLILRNTITFKK